MFTRNRVHTSRERSDHRNKAAAHSVLAVFSSKEPRHRSKSDGRGINISGVDFWHAVEFSRNGRFLCTHPLGLSSRRFPSVFQTLSVFFRPPDHRPAGMQKMIRDEI